MERYSGIADCKRSKQPASTSDLRMRRLLRPAPSATVRLQAAHAEGWGEDTRSFGQGDKMDRFTVVSPTTVSSRP